MKSDLPPNTISRPYRGLSAQDVDVALDPGSLQEYLDGREVYRRTEFLLLRHDGDAALVRVQKAPGDDLFVPVVHIEVLALPDEVIWLVDENVDCGNATALAEAARPHIRDGVDAYVVTGRFEHVNFIWKPQFTEIRVREVIPPQPAKLMEMARHVVEFDEDLPPIELVPDYVDIREIVSNNTAASYLLPCRGAGGVVQSERPGQSMAYLDTRPSQLAGWLLVGCGRSRQFYEHFYEEEPVQVDICPRKRPLEPDSLTLTKCCLRERGIGSASKSAEVPWGATLDEVRAALRLLVGLALPVAVDTESALG